MKNVGVLYHPKLSEAVELAHQVSAQLESEGRRCWIHSAWEEKGAREKLPSTDLLITLGGDGTILRASRIAACTGVPILSVNFGKLGFLAELLPNDLLRDIPYFLAGEGWIEERVMLHVELPREIHALDAFGTTTYKELPAANEALIGRGALSRMISAQVLIDGAALTTYNCDGVIIATPTGSTAYSLSVGGPILHPESGSLIVVPIAPHLCFSTPLVIPSGASVEVRLKAQYPATLSVDGQIDFLLESGETVKVKKNEHPALYLRRRPRNYFYGSLVGRLGNN